MSDKLKNLLISMAKTFGAVAFLALIAHVFGLDAFPELLRTGVDWVVVTALLIAFKVIRVFPYK
jgi:hypothetical protein